MSIKQINDFLNEHGIKLISIMYNKNFEPFKSKIKNHGDKLIVIKKKEADTVEIVVDNKNKVKSLNGVEPEQNIDSYVSKIIEIYHLNIVDSNEPPNDVNSPELNLEFMFFLPDNDKENSDPDNDKENSDKYILGIIEELEKKAFGLRVKKANAALTEAKLAVKKTEQTKTLDTLLETTERAVKLAERAAGAFTKAAAPEAAAETAATALKAIVAAAKNAAEDAVNAAEDAAANDVKDKPDKKKRAGENEKEEVDEYGLPIAPPLVSGDAAATPLASSHAATELEKTALKAIVAASKATLDAANAIEEAALDAANAIHEATGGYKASNRKRRLYSKQAVKNNKKNQKYYKISRKKQSKPKKHHMKTPKLRKKNSTSPDKPVNNKPPSKKKRTYKQSSQIKKKKKSQTIKNYTKQTTNQTKN